LPSTAVITDNQILQVGQGANGVNLADYGTVGTLNAVVSQNTVQTNTSCKCYATNSPGDYSAIISNSSSSLTVWQNTILGGGSAGVYIKGGPAVIGGNTITGSYDGVWVDQANGVHVTDNVIKNSAQYGIALTDESSHNVITGNLIKTSGTFDLCWDQTGTGNTWQGNQYDTSSPPGLG